jgi:hypothetical protein
LYAFSASAGAYTEIVTLPYAPPLGCVEFIIGAATAAARYVLMRGVGKNSYRHNPEGPRVNDATGMLESAVYPSGMPSSVIANVAFMPGSSKPGLARRKYVASNCVTTVGTTCPASSVKLDWYSPLLSVRSGAE